MPRYRVERRLGALDSWAALVTGVTFSRTPVSGIPLRPGLCTIRVRACRPPDVNPATSETCVRRTRLLACHGGSRQHCQTNSRRGGDVLSKSTVRASVKITSALFAALALSLAGAGSALADPTGGDASGSGDFGFDVTGPQLPPPPPLPAPPTPSASASAGTSVGVDTPLGSADGGFSTGFGGDLGLPTLPPPPAPPPAPSASASAGTHLGFGF